MTWSQCKITVLKTMYNQDLAEAYRRPDIHQAEAGHDGTRVEPEDADGTRGRDPQRHRAGLQPQSPRPPAARCPHQVLDPCTLVSAPRKLPGSRTCAGETIQSAYDTGKVRAPARSPP